MGNILGIVVGFELLWPVDSKTCEKKASEMDNWFTNRLGLKLKVYDVVLGRGTYNPPMEDRLTHQQTQKTPEAHTRDIPIVYIVRPRLYAPRLLVFNPPRPDGLTNP